MAEETVVLSWRTPKRVLPERGRNWYIAAAVFVVLCLLYGIFSHSWSTLLVFALLAGVYWLYHKEPFAETSFLVGTAGFQDGDRFTPWTDCAGFWMLQGPGYVELHIQRKSGRSREAVTLLPTDINFQQARAILTGFIPEFSDRKERLLDTVIRLLKI